MTVLEIQADNDGGLVKVEDMNVENGEWTQNGGETVGRIKEPYRFLV